MSDYDVIVIGAGNGGLASAAYLANKGVKVLVLERHNVPGGCATSFRRGRFEFEVSLHQLSGLGTPEMPGPLSNIFQRLGIFDKLEFYEMTDIYNFQYIPEKRSIMLPPDIKEISSILQGLFPAEKQGIEDYINLLSKVAHGIMCVQYMNDPDSSKEKYPEYFKFAAKSTQEVMDQFLSDPVLKSVLSAYCGYLGLPPHLLSFGQIAICYQAYCDFKPTHIKGGSQALSNALADAIIRNGGRIHYNCEAKKIIIKDGRVQGVITNKGEEITSRFVVSNASKIATYYELLDPGQTPKKIRDELRQVSLACSAFVLYLGFDVEPEELGFTESTNFVLGTSDSHEIYNRMKSLSISERDAFGVTCYNLIDQSFSPKGTTQVQATILKYADPWYKVPPAQYADTKYRCAESVLDALKPFYPDLKKHIEEIEIATPVTMTRYLGTLGGTFYGFDRFIKDNDQFRQKESGIPGLYNAGVWTEMTGYQPTYDSGIKAARKILKEIYG